MTTYAERNRPELIRRRDYLRTLLDTFPPYGHRSQNFVDRIMIDTVTAGINALEVALRGACPEDPRQLRGQPIGNYHCPWCGCTCLVGVDHGATGHDDGCQLGLNEVPVMIPNNGSPVTRVEPNSGGTWDAYQVGPPKFLGSFDTEPEARAAAGLPESVTDAPVARYNGPCANKQHQRALWDGVLNHVCPEPPGARYDGPCFDPQCRDSTWDHECPAPPGEYEVRNGMTVLVGEAADEL